jgi:uncharacterized protein (TIGR02391 family)
MKEPEFRKILSGSPLSITPHIKRVVNSLNYNNLIYVVGEKIEPSEFSVELLLSFGTFQKFATVQDFRPSTYMPPPIKNKDEMHNIANIKLQTLPNERTLFILTSSDGYTSNDKDALEYFLIQMLNELKILGFSVPEDPKPTTQARSTSIIERANDVFDAMQFHPKVIECSRSLFIDGHYTDAIFRAFTAISNYVKDRTDLDIDGKALMSRVFNEEQPILQLNNLQKTSDRDEQEGFKFLYMGATIGIRNPKAHENVEQTNPYRALEYLGLASLLIQKAEEGKIKAK